MGRMWIRLSLSFGVVLLVATALMSGAFALLLHQGKITPDFPKFEEDSMSLSLDAPLPTFLHEIALLPPPDGVVAVAGGVVVNAFGFEIPVRLFAILSTSISLALGLLAGVWVSRSISRPVTRLALAAQAIGDHDLSSRVEIKGSRELVDLAQTFNQMAADLERAEQLRVNLVADVAHELRTPLTVLEGNLRALLDGVFDLSEEEVARLYTQTHHLTRLVEDLRELAHAEAGRLCLNVVATDMTQLVAQSVEMFTGLAEEKGLHLTGHASGRIPMIAVDPHRMRQVLHNLISNSIRYTPSGGHVSVQTELGSGELRISVHDDGIGIAPEELANIFDRFHRINRQHDMGSSGTGLGLAIAMAVVKAHGGTIDVRSPGPDLGSTFTVRVPIAPSDGELAA